MWAGDVSLPVVAVGYLLVSCVVILLAGFGGPAGVMAAALMLAGVVALLVSWSNGAMGEADENPPALTHAGGKTPRRG